MIDAIHRHLWLAQGKMIAYHHQPLLNGPNSQGEILGHTPALFAYGWRNVVIQMAACRSFTGFNFCHERQSRMNDS